MIQSDSIVTGWHFSNGRLRDGRPIVVGQWEVHYGALVMCMSGYHLSIRACDALKYAPGSYVGVVEGRGDRIESIDKITFSERRYVTKPINVGPLLRDFARWCALQVLNCWDASQCVRNYLHIGGESLRDDALASAVKAASESSSELSKESAVEYIAQLSESDVMHYAAWCSVQAAVWSAGKTSALTAALVAAWYAAQAIVWSDVQGDVRSSASSAERFAKRIAAQSAQNTELERLLSLNWRTS